MQNWSERDGVTVRPLRTVDDLRAVLAEIESLMAAEADTPEGDRPDVLVSLVEAREVRHVPVEAPDPIAAIVFMMEQKGLSRRDLAPAIQQFSL
jgi:HTH-type transcriptional regulator / antitoxin HigA